MSVSISYSGLHGYADVGRYGLGHSLLAWARCWNWCQMHSLPMLAPNWRHIRIGPWLRGERDNRQYHRLFRFDDYITGPRRFWLLKTSNAWSAESEDLDKLLSDHRQGIVIFNNRLSLNEEMHFHEVIGKGPLLREALESMTRLEYRPSPLSQPHIALHVRMGDFGQSASLEALRSGSKNSRLPVEWYLRILDGLRELLGHVPAIVYSDGDETSLAELLRLPNVSRSPRQPSVTDMLSISRATILISSGSGFSMWGSFLGDIPRICFPGQRFVRVLGEPLGVDREPEVESVEELSVAFVDAISERFKSGAKG